ncbi:hypothetical protein B9Z55_005482 [Caenorhabditis nigoni]|uniref:Nucleoprotein TPR n=1 Tax=Caenorhabditis nigoni TaxID=1611254 RepID=A0A2G5V123_9PELO|nr:hypothetical protein B9Z55_005482 [Caenorhabditis nigoni]
MDVDTPSTDSAAPLPVETDDEQANWKIEKAMLTTESHNINQELKDVRDRLAEVGEVNKRLSDELSVKVAQLQDQTGRQRLLEAERNELTDKRLELESEVARLKSEKEERDAAAIQAGKWTQSAQLETFTLRDEVQKLTAELANFKYTKEALEKEVQSIQYEREKYNNERSLHAESKRWLMQEVSERDNKVSSLRLELSNKDIEGANERLQYNQQINLLRAQVGSLTEKVDMLTFTNSDLSKRIENAELSKATEIANLEDEIRRQVDLQRVMKTSMEEAKNAADHFKDQLDAQENILAEVRRVLQEHQDYMERENIAHAEAIKQKDEELAQLRAELAKASEKMKSMSDVIMNLSEEELSELAPAAADTVRYLRGGQSLSSLVLEHARVSGKLTEVERENLNLRTTLEELLETIDQSKPQLMSQRRVAEELYDKNNKFEKQLDLAESERRELISQRDTAQRDLAYIRAELEKYQRDFEFVSKRNADLLYAAERQRDPNRSDEPNPQLYESIVQLQRRNVELESDIDEAKTSAAKAATKAQSEEMAQLRADLLGVEDKSGEDEGGIRQRKKEIEQLKQRAQQSPKVPNLAPQLEQLKSQLKTSHEELAATNERVKSAEAAKTAAEEKLKNIRTSLTKVLVIATKYRDQNLALKAELGPWTSAAAVRSNNDEGKSRRSTEEKMAELQTQIDEARKEAENANMEVLRMSVMMIALEKNSDQLNELRQQDEKLAENNRLLTNQQQSSSSTDMESKSLGVTRAGLPVPHMFQSSVRVPAPSLFSSSSTTTVQPQAEKRSVLPNIDSVPTTPASNPSLQVTTTSSITTGQKMFGGEITTSSSADNLLLPEESVAEGAAGQSSLVSGSIDQQKSESANDGKSRDSSSMGGVSSSDARRKRAANDFEMSEAKRQRESPNEDPNDNTLNDNQDEVIDLENDEEVIEDEMEGDEDDDDDSFGNDEEYEDDRAPEEVDEDDVVVISDEDDAPENDNDAESLNDDDIEEIEIEDSNNDVMEDVLGGEDSQPSLDDQDREAASAVEEAEDEGRDPLVGLDEPSAPADPTGAGVGGNSGMQRVRLPTGIREAERDDQCSSSNETTEERPEAQLSARQACRQRPPQGAKPTRGVYRPGRGGRGGGIA